MPTPTTESRSAPGASPPHADGAPVHASSSRHQIWFDGALSGSLVQSLQDDPDQLLSRGVMLKDGDRCTVARIDHDGRSMVLKRYNFRDPLHTLVHMFMRSRARWSWSNGHRLRELGFVTPRPLAMVEQRIGPLRLRSFLLMEHVEGESLAAAVQRDQHDAARLGALASGFKRLWDALGQQRITYGDLKASNLLIDRAQVGEPWWLIDLDGMRFHRGNLRFRRERGRDLDSFMRNWLAMPKAAAAFGRAI